MEEGEKLKGILPSLNIYSDGKKSYYIKNNPKIDFISGDSYSPIYDEDFSKMVYNYLARIEEYNT